MNKHCSERSINFELSNNIVHQIKAQIAHEIKEGYSSINIVLDNKHLSHGNKNNISHIIYVLKKDFPKLTYTCYENGCINTAGNHHISITF